MMQRLVMELATATDIPTLAHSVMWRTLLHQVESDPNLLTAIAHRIRADRD